MGRFGGRYVLGAWIKVFCRIYGQTFQVERTVKPWRSLEEGDEQLERPNRQPFME